MESVALVAPVTALEFTGDVLLAGTGPEVAAFRLSGGGSPAGRRSVLREASVQGLRAEPGTGRAVRVVAFGGRWLSVLSVRRCGAGGEGVLAACGGGAVRELGAWVWEARWAAGGRLALALGGGTVGLYEWRGGGHWLRWAGCGGAGALRCAVLAGTGWEQLALAAGTAAGPVVVWRAAAAAAPRRRLLGHRGAVLALCYSAPRGLLASASEDRSVRLWAVGELGGEGNGDGEGSCLLVCYGHGARVAAVALRGPCPVSAGEDGTCLEWDGGGGVRRARRGHYGALRAVALRPAGGCLATGGDDGGVRLWRPRRAAPVVVAALGVPERARAVLLVGPRQVLVLGEAGGLSAYETATERWVPVLPPAAVGPRGMLAAAPLPGGAEVLCALGTGDGRVLLFALGRPEAAVELRLFEGAVRGLGWAQHSGLPPAATSLLASGPDGEVLWLDVAHRPGQVPRVQLRGRYQLPPCKQRWHTCAAFLPQGGLLLCGDRRGSLLLFPCSSSLGQAAGSTGISNGSPDLVSEDSSSDSCLPSCLLHKEALPRESPLSLLFGLHGKTGVTSVTCYGDYIYSTGRDGVYRQLRLQGQQLEVLRKHRPCKGLQWIEKLCFTLDGDLLVLGFHADNFVVWSSRTNENLHCIPCGGGHRSWSYCSSSSDEAFAFIKCGDVMLYHHEAKPCEQQVLLPSLHGREISCVRRLGAVGMPGHPALNVFITGSEDTMACVLALREGSRAAIPLTRLTDHISSVRALALAHTAGPSDEGFDKGLSALLFSAGGRAQIECNRVVCARDPASESAVACQVIHVASHRLDEHWERKKNRHKLVKMDPETRYMSLSVMPDTSSEQLPTPWKFLAAACSDGSVRVFGLLEAAQKLVLVAESFHHERCVLKVEAFLHTQAGGERRHLLCSAATDGSVAFWDITSPIAEATAALHRAEGELQPLALGSPLLTIMAHSCGVNSLHIHMMQEGQYLVASGSDDGSIHICLLEVTLSGGEVTTGTCMHVLQRVAKPCAHAAHVTGIRVLRPDLLLSASVDQRLTLWHHSPGRLDPLSTTFFHVPDLAELDCWEVVDAGGMLQYCCVLCGYGLEMLHGIAPPKPPLPEAPL